MDIKIIAKTMTAGDHYKYIDPAYINEMADGEDEFIVQVLDIYLSSMPAHIARLAEVAQGTDYAEIIFGTHKLRSSLNFIGGQQMISVLDKIDVLCTAQTDLPTIRELVKAVAGMAGEINAELGYLLEQVKNQ